MTTNREKAAKVIDRLRSKGKGSYLIAAGLDAEGLLAPDLPQHDVVSANGTPVWQSDSTLMVTALNNSHEVRMWLLEAGEVVYTPHHRP